MPLASAVECLGPISVDQPRAAFNVVFDEPIATVLANFTNSKGEEFPLEGPTPLDSTNTLFQYSVPVLLTDENYTFSMWSVDRLGNRDFFCQEYELVVAPLQLQLVRPHNGYSPTRLVNVSLLSDSEAVCRYSFRRPLPFFHRDNSMAPFEQTSLSLVHTGLFPESSDNARHLLYVKCNRSDGLINEDNPFLFNLSIDTTPASIQGGRIFPSDDNTVVSFPAQTTLYVTTDDPTRCLYSTDYNHNFSEMEDTFEGFDEEVYSTENRVFLEGLQDNVTYNFTIACENQAGLVSDPFNYSFDVNLGTASTLTILEPDEHIRRVPISLLVATNKPAVSCMYSDVDGEFNHALDSEDFFSHNATLSNFNSDGEFTYYILCEYSEGTVRKDSVTFTIDRTGPRIFNITQVNTCVENELSVSWEFEDEHSRLSSFDYRISSGSRTILNWTRTREKTFVYTLTNTSSSSSYYVTIKGQDTAGNVGDEFRSSGSLKPSDLEAQVCLENDPPVGRLNVTLVNNALSVAVECYDVGSGCDTSKIFYGQSPTASCSPELKYSRPVTVTTDGVFCWKVTDSAGNIATGKETLSLERDSDGDGVPDALDRCASTLAFQTVDASGCSVAQQDADGDGVSDADDDCRNTPLGAAVDVQGCPLDGDDDGMPDYWEVQYDLDPNDPSDADGDIDGDGATNLEEYEAGTDPTNRGDSPSTSGRTSDDDSDGDSPGSDLDEDDLDADDDFDGIPDSWEEEFCRGDCDPDEDLDGDGLTNLREYRYDTHPEFEDTDGDGYTDGEEVEAGTDPTDDTSKPSSNLLPLILLSLGILFILGGTGYVVYKKYFSQGGSSPPLQGYPQQPQARPSQQPQQQPYGSNSGQRSGTVQPQQTTQQPAYEEKSKPNPFSSVFDRFSKGKKDEDSIHQITLPKKKPVSVPPPALKKQGLGSSTLKGKVKSNVPQTPSPTQKPVQQKQVEPTVKKQPSNFDKLSKVGGSAFDKLSALTSLSDYDIEKILGAIDGNKIFQALDEINAGMPANRKILAFGDLSKVLQKKGVPKSVMDKLKKQIGSVQKPSSFDALSSMDGKGTFEDLKNIESNEAALKKLSKRVKKK